MTGIWRTEPCDRDRLNSPQSNTTYPNRHMHAREIREEQQHAPRRVGGGAIAPATGLDRRGPLASPPARSTATAATVASAAAAALVERREDEAMSRCLIPTKRS